MDFVLANTALCLNLHCIDKQPAFAELSDVAANQTLANAPIVHCMLGEEFEELVTTCEQRTPSELAILWLCNSPHFEATLIIRLNDNSLTIQFSALGDYATIHVGFPLLSALFPAGGAGDDRIIRGADSFRDAQNQPMLRRVQWALPCVRIAPDGRALTLLAGDSSATLMPDAAQLASQTGFDLMLDSTPQTFIEAELVLHSGGWRAAFGLFRQRIRAGYDLAQYGRPDLAWYREQLVQHFTFLYGREILDLDSGQFNLERFIAEGERLFGGYDGMLAWGAYPRIGIDERSQWDFYDDLPGGRDALCSMARRARERGVRFFVPYLPWDNSAELHGQMLEPAHASLAKLVADVEADGVFLDTMSATGAEMRAALDQARSGVVFCSEGRPKGDALQVVTGSWDQSQLVDGPQGNWSPPREHMPGADLWRFVLPEHRQFVTSRHAQGDDRLRVIQRGFFNATGWVVWQDIFGLALPWTPDEAGLLKKCRTLLREHREAVWSAQPTPLIETTHEGVYANEFPAESKRLWMLYNDSDKPTDAVVLRIAPRLNHHIVDVWNDCEARLDTNGGIHAHIEPHSIGALVELPRLLTYTDGVVSIAQPIPGAVIQIRSWSAESLLPAGTIRVGAIMNGRSRIIRLLRGGELLDQIEVPA